MVNQQGTLKEDSSETIRIIKFNKQLNKAFINWFIGFIEGCENVFIVNRRFLRFELNVSYKDESIIYLIKNKLKFGNIRKLKFLDTIILEYSVQDNYHDLLSLINIFNGNLRCKNKEQQFLIFYKKLKIKLKKLNLLELLPDYKNEIKLINFSNSWLSGYIDSGKVLFSARWHKSKKLKEGKQLYLSCIFWHLNRDLLLQIKDLLNSNSEIEYKVKWNLPFFKFVILNQNEKNIIINYLLKYKLKSKISNRYKYWKILLNFENIYLETGIQNLEQIEKILCKFNSTISEGELNKL
jgi:hypothetical protein